MQRPAAAIRSSRNRRISHQTAHQLLRGISQRNVAFTLPGGQGLTPDLSLLTGFSRGKTMVFSVGHVWGVGPRDRRARAGGRIGCTLPVDPYDPHPPVFPRLVGCRVPRRGVVRVGPHHRSRGEFMSAKHHGRTPLLRLLARLGWQRDPDLWTVPCRDQRGRRARLIVALTATGIALASTSPEGVELTPLEVGQLRGALRDALLTLDRLAGGQQLGVRPLTRRREQPVPPAGAPRTRQRIRLDRLSRPSVAEIVSRLDASATSDLEVDHEHGSTHNGEHGGHTWLGA